MSQATVLDLFDYGEGVYTVGFSKLIERAAVMLNLRELAQGAPLREKIDDLTNYRNKIVHFSIEVQLDEAASLLADLMEPFLTLLEREVKDENFVRQCIPYVRASAESVSAVYRLKYTEIETRISKLIEKFDGQQVPGRLFGVDGTLILPKFTEAKHETSQKDIRADILAKNDSEQWIVELKLASPNAAQYHQLLSYREYLQRLFDNVKIWMVIMGTSNIPSRTFLKRNQILFSSEPDIVELEQLLK